MTVRQLMSSRDARVYLTGQSFSLFGDTSMFLALGIWTKELTHSNAAAGLTFFFGVLAALFSPLAGILVDRVRRRPLLVAVNFLSALGVLLLLLVHSSSGVWIIYFTMFLYGFAGNFIGAAQSAFLTVLLPPDQLGDANGFLRTVREGLRLIAGVVIDDIKLFNDKLLEWENFYNYARPHGALGGQTPYDRLKQKSTATV